MNFVFGSGYQVMESAEMLEDGIYLAKIKAVKMENGNYGAYLLVDVSIKDHEGANPSRFILNDSPKSNSPRFTQQQLLEMWCKSMTKFFRNFQIPEGNFNFNSWVGKIGKVTIRPQKNNPQYKEIVPYEVKSKPKMTEQKPVSNFGASFPLPQEVQQVANAFSGEVVSAGQSNILDNFPDEIPF